MMPAGRPAGPAAVKTPGSNDSINFSVKSWIEKIRSGDVRAVARACSLIENEDSFSEEILAAAYRFSGRAVVVGITGPPGAGKSTLLSCLIDEAIAHHYSVGVIAVDPSSPISGGAILADRLRISSANHDQVYIRSLATRGSSGSLAWASFGILRVIEAMGKDVIFVETVGSGQNELAVTNLATTTIFVTVPNLGDEIQALKAGILEVCDIFVVNKSDIGNAEIAVAQLRSALSWKDLSEQPPARHHSLRSSTAALPSSGAPPAPASWSPPILSVSAAHKKGVAQIFTSIFSHQDFLKSSGEMDLRRRRQVQSELFFVLERKLAGQIRSKCTDKALNTLLEKRKDPHSLAREILSGKRSKK